MIHIDNLILGAGIAGLGAGQKLKESGKKYLILEKDDTYGGLCGNFTIDGFRFDRFVHLSFTEEKYVRKFFDQTDYHTHIPNPHNYYHGIWIKHPAQNNLFPLSDDEKKQMLSDMEKRQVINYAKIKNYEQWLRAQFGNYFAEHFPMIYTKKYWGVNAKELEIKWIRNRIYQPTIEEVVKGMQTCETPITYYAKEMRYPKMGGFKSFLKSFSNEENIRYNCEVLSIDPFNKVVKAKRGSYHYKNLYSTLPLSEYIILMNISEHKVVKAINNLKWTSGYIISLGMKGELNNKDLWDYIYDEHILPARIYSPSEKSPDNCPDGCCSLQAEVYYKNDNLPVLSNKEILENVINEMDGAYIIDKTKIIIKDIRFEKYANVIFDMNIYESRNIVINFLKSNSIIPFGRFGEWDYLWSNQSFLSGYNIL